MPRILVLCGLLSLFVPSCDNQVHEGPTLTYRLKRLGYTVHLDDRMDILLVIDNAPSMTGKQVTLANSLNTFIESLGHYFNTDQIHLAVITTSQESSGCPLCSMMIEDDCFLLPAINQNLRDFLGRVTWSANGPTFEFSQDESCQVVRDENLECLFDPENETGTALVGIEGCPYRRGLAAMRNLLSQEHLKGEDARFLREGAPLTVIYISDGEDCGEVGDVSERAHGVEEKICSYAAKGVGPGGETIHPYDPDGRPYDLTPVEEYYDFLLSLKNNRKGMAKFIAITGVKDIADLSTTTIEYESTDPNAPVVPACSMPECPYGNCDALPGTRAIELAQMFEYHGFVDTICQNNYFDSMVSLVEFVDYSCSFRLEEPALDPDLIAFYINDEPLPKHSCSVTDRLVPCDEFGAACEVGTCTNTWSYFPPQDPYDPPMILFGDHFKPYELAGDHPIEIRIDIVYAVH